MNRISSPYFENIQPKEQYSEYTISLTVFNKLEFQLESQMYFLFYEMKHKH